jgi:hypothetical protein
MAEEIRARFIFEMLGAPAEHLKETLEKFVESLGEVKGIEIKEKKLHEPKKIEESKGDLFTNFAEVELTIENLRLLIGLVMNRLPSSVEIIEPEALKLNNFDLSSALSELVTKLHRYDEVAKVMTINSHKFKNKIKELQDRIKELEKEKGKEEKKEDGEEDNNSK